MKRRRAEQKSMHLLSDGGFDGFLPRVPLQWGRVLSADSGRVALRSSGCAEQGNQLNRTGDRGGCRDDQIVIDYVLLSIPVSWRATTEGDVV